ncbi:GMC oxidoreductase [Halomonas stenophila]|uniref:Choline dehydrogenase-like flavoprotein n=1 Tax=Halomonas stenophila TaxID=795312 RepID=A0A7W5ETT2_9GAMM|nr:GMC oxidoreductase [Halomonas stenophila]MBB3231308.1 choline dehydrogenase-like flavoprotein [Halomonas stenophila]
MDHVFFLSHAEWKAAREENAYDYVVVGTGFCALAFAQRVLEANPHSRILMIERGAFFLPEHFQNLPLPFKDTLGGLSETFPWTLSATTALGKDGPVRWQHGMVPFFGGRSTLWSAWCPRPNGDELAGWPQATIEAARRNFETAEALLRVQKADQIDLERSTEELRVIGKTRPVYGPLQRCIQSLLRENGASVDGIYRTQAAPLASAAENVNGIDFQKYSTPGDILALADRQAKLHAAGKGARLDIVSDCTVDKIQQQEIDGARQATALETSRGVLPLGAAQLILAMGTLPPTTLLRNSFPDTRTLGERFSAHFISSIVARVPKSSLDPQGQFGDLELSACYVAGVADDSYEQQFHIQLSSLWDVNPAKNAGTALRYMPDVVATASQVQLQTSEGYVVFVCAVLGELDYDNPGSWFLRNHQDGNVTTNSLLQVRENARDYRTWDAMDEATFGILEEVLSPEGVARVEYWLGAPDKGEWSAERPGRQQRRVDALVHESSTLYLGEEESAPVDLNYRFRGSNNVYVTGGGLWPRGGSWNPTMTMVALAQDLADKLEGAK